MSGGDESNREARQGKTGVRVSCQDIKSECARYMYMYIRSDEGLTLGTSAFRISVQWPIYIINSVDKTKFLYTCTCSLGMQQ